MKFKGPTLKVKGRLAGRLRVSENRVRGSCLCNRRQLQTGENSIMKSFMTSKHQLLYILGDQIKEDEIGGACGMYGGEKRNVSFS
jgi:hypothetical protein